MNPALLFPGCDNCKEGSVLHAQELLIYKLT